MPSNLKLWSALIVVVAIAIVAYLSYRSYYGAGTIVLEDGTEVRDFSVAEAGEFAASDSEPLRRAHFEARNELRESELIALPSYSVQAVREAIEPAVQRALRENAAARRTLASGDAEAGLVQMIARVVSAAAGLPRQEYVASLPPGVSLQRPGAFAAVELTAEELGGSLELPAENAADADWQPAFEAVYDRAREHDGEALRVRGIVADVQAIVIAVAPHEDARDHHLVRWQYGEEMYDRFVQVSAQPQPVFYQPDRGHQDSNHSHGSRSGLMDAAIVFVVEDGSGDHYPISISADYDPDRPEGGRWAIRHISRLSSPRIFVSPFFAF